MHKNHHRLENGDRLYRGQAICYSHLSSGALEFGLDVEGHPIYWGHYSHLPEYIIWTDRTVQGEFLVLQDDALLLYEYEFGRAVWGVGHCLPIGVGQDYKNNFDTPSDNRALTIHENGIVSLAPAEGGGGGSGSGSGNNDLWTLDLDGTMTSACPDFLPLDDSNNGGSNDPDDEMGQALIATSVVAGVFFVTTVVLAWLLLHKKSSRNGATSTRKIAPSSNTMSKLEMQAESTNCMWEVDTEPETSS